MSDDPPGQDKSDNLARTFRAFRSPNYRLFFFGQGLSLIGTWMQTLAMGWLVYRLTHSPWLLGVIGFCGQIPIFLLGPIAGVLADRFPRRRILTLTQSLAMLQAFTLGALVLSGAIQVWHVVAMSLFLGTVNAFDMPTRQSFIVEIVPGKEDIGNAIAMNSTMFNSARLIGPMIAGLVIKLAGEGVCFAINGVSFLAMIIALRRMRLPPRPARMEHNDMMRGMREGLSYALRSPAILTVLVFVAAMSLVGMPYGVLMPVMARTVLGGGSDTLGWLLGSGGIGAMIGALFLAARRSSGDLGKTAATAAVIFGGGLIGLALSRYIPLSMAMMVLAGMGMTVQMASNNTTVQTIVEDSKRGRVMSLYVMAHIGVAPFGALLAGGLAQRIGAPNTLLIAGACSAAFAGLLALRLSLFRPRTLPADATNPPPPSLP